MQYGNDTVYAHYANFSIDSKERHFTLSVSGYIGTAGKHREMSFFSAYVVLTAVFKIYRIQMNGQHFPRHERSHLVLMPS